MITVIGSTGFIGSNLTKYFKNKNYEIYNPPKNSEEIFSKNLGDVFYCAGLTADFRVKTFETIDAHVHLLSKLLKNSNFNSLLYFSSARVYKNSKNTNEDTSIEVNPNDSDSIYNISKLLGESLCLNFKNKNVKVVRLTNVIGINDNSNNFLNSILKDCIINSELTLKSSLDSNKDYIFIDDILEIIEKILFFGNEKIYNISQGLNVSTEEIINLIKEKINFKLRIEKNATKFEFPEITNQKIVDEFNFKPGDIKENIKFIINELVDKHKGIKN